MYAKATQVVTLIAGFTASGVAATGLTVTCKVWELAADGSKSPNDTTGTTATVAEVGGGVYRTMHTMAGDGVPLAVFSTADSADTQCVQTSALALDDLASLAAVKPAHAPTVDTDGKVVVSNVPAAPTFSGTVSPPDFAGTVEFNGTVNAPEVDMTPVTEAISAIPAPVFGGTVSPPAFDGTVTFDGTVEAPALDPQTLIDAGLALAGEAAAAAQTVIDHGDGAGAWGATGSTTVTDGQTITPATLGIDDDPLGVVMPLGEITVYVVGESEAFDQFDADENGDYSFQLPYGSLWRLVAKRPGKYKTTEMEVSTEVGVS